MNKVLIPALTLVCGFTLGAYAMNPSPINILPGQKTEPLTSGAAAPVLVTSPMNETSAVQPMVDTSIDSLARSLELEIQQRKFLEEQFNALQAELRDLADKISASASAGDEASSEINIPVNHSPKIEVESFVSAGFEYPQAVEMKRRLDQFELDRLNLQHQANQEGWINSERYIEEQTRLNERATSFRDELDETDYDRYLYATGQANRVKINSIMDGSTAQQVGLHAGDLIMRYNGKRVYNWSELRTAIFNDTTDPMVPVVIDRNGKAIEIFVPQGPLGVRLDMAIVEPS